MMPVYVLYVRSSVVDDVPTLPTYLPTFGYNTYALILSRAIHILSLPISVYVSTYLCPMMYLIFIIFIFIFILFIITIISLQVIF